MARSIAISEIRAAIVFLTDKNKMIEDRLLKESEIGRVKVAGIARKLLDTILGLQTLSGTIEMEWAEGFE